MIKHHISDVFNLNILYNIIKLSKGISRYYKNKQLRKEEEKSCFWELRKEERKIEA